MHAPLAEHFDKMAAPPSTALDPETKRMIAALHPKHRASIKALAVLQNRVCTHFDETHLQRSHDGYLYHYSNDIGLFAILQTRVLWLSDYTTLNDPKEISYGIEIGYGKLKEICDLDGSPLALELSKHMSEIIEGSTRVVKYYILSMSLADDELGQWRSYGNNGYGYSLEFDATILINEFNKKHRSLSQAFKVLYDADLLNSLMASLCANALEAVKNLVQVSPKDDRDCIVTIANALFLEMSFVALHFKHPAYYAEQEFRFLIVSPQIGPSRITSKSRVRNHRLIDLTEFKWPKLSLTGIVSGPTVNVDDAARFANVAIRSNIPGSTVKVRHSDIPYRS